MATFNIDKRTLSIGIFLFICLIITLFPPYNWTNQSYLDISETNKNINYNHYFGEHQRISNEQNISLFGKGKKIDNYGGEVIADFARVLPVKKYSFLFSDSKSDFVLPCENNRTGCFTLYRQLIVSDIILEYVLTFFLVLFSSLILKIPLSGLFKNNYKG